MLKCMFKIFKLFIGNKIRHFCKDNVLIRNIYRWQDWPLHCSIYVEFTVNWSSKCLHDDRIFRFIKNSSSLHFADFWLLNMNLWNPAKALSIASLVFDGHIKSQSQYGATQAHRQSMTSITTMLLKIFYTPTAIILPKFKLHRIAVWIEHFFVWRILEFNWNTTHVNYHLSWKPRGFINR